MNICFIYTNHPVYKDSNLSVPKFLFNLILALKKINPDWNLSIIAPEGTSINGVNVFEFKKSGILFFFNTLIKKAFRKLKINYDDSKINKYVLKKFINVKSNYDVYFCTKYTDILSLNKIIQTNNIIQFNCSIFGIFENSFSKNNFYKALNLSSTFIIGSKFVFNEILKEFNLNKLNSDVIMIPASVDFLDEIYSLRSTGNKKIFRDYFGLKEEELVILHIGGNNPIKGKEIILNIIKNKINTNRKICFLSVGNQTERHINLSDNLRVIELDKLSDDKFIKALIASDLGVTPTQVLEPGPGVTLQMQYAGLVVLGSGTGGNLEYINDGYTGFLVNNPKDEKNWTEKLDYLIKNFDSVKSNISLNLIPGKLYNPGIEFNIDKWKQGFLKFKSKTQK